MASFTALALLLTAEWTPVLAPPSAAAQDAPKPDDPKKPDEPKPDEPKKPDAPKPDEPKKEEPKKPDEKPAAPAPAGPSAKRPEAKPKSTVKPFDDVIPAYAKSQKGLFWVHTFDDKILYEIPPDVFSKPMLWVTSVAKIQSGAPYQGMPPNDRVVKWEQRDDKVLLRDVRYQIRADVDDPIKDAVAAWSLSPIIQTFPVLAYGKDKAPVIDVTSIFTGDLPEFSVARRFGGAGVDPARTFIEKVKAFPENIETAVLATFRSGGGGMTTGRGPQPTPSPSPFGGAGGGTITAEIRTSMVKLPDEPMRPRKYDDRVGFFTVGFQDFGDQSKHQLENVQYINRWRLEKKDPSAEVSEPKKPIVYYIGREVPAKWRPYVKKGIEAWQPAFEAAGFKNAILAKEPPSFREDPDWDAEDARYSVIRWLPSPVENAMGPHIHDPRTGEILEADILMYHNVLKLARDWYFVQASPNDERAQQIPLPDDLVGELLAYIVAHEVGHTLGFPHNMKASSSYTVANLRDKEFTKKYGTEASIMDYGRFNYVAQPGDGAALIPVIGPYDFFAVEWGYKQFKDAPDYKSEKAKLDEIVARQLTDPKLLFGDPDGVDPSAQTEDLSADPIEATELGLKNIERVAGYLVKATCKKGENYDMLRNMYSQLLAQRNRELGHVVSLIGGVTKTNVYFGDGDKPYAAVPTEKQKKAVEFLINNGFTVPTPLIAPDITERLGATGTADQILSSQISLLSRIVNESRIRRMAELAQQKPDGAYTPLALMNDIRDGVWKELAAEKIDIDLYRRNLQRGYVNFLAQALGTGSGTSDFQALARNELITLQNSVTEALKKPVSEVAKLHLEDIQARVKQALEPKIVTAGQQQQTIFFPFDGNEPPTPFRDCFPH
jgi:hypothetical protein